MCLQIPQQIRDGIITSLESKGVGQPETYLSRLHELEETATGMFERIAAAPDLTDDYKVDILAEAIWSFFQPSSPPMRRCLEDQLEKYAFQHPTSFPRGKLASRFLPADTFFEHGVNRSSYTAKDLIRMIEDGNFSHTHLRDPISSRTGIVFFTETGAVSTPEEISYLLGSEALLEETEYIELIFDPKELKIYVPTTVDAFAYPYFRPSQSGAHQGQTLNLCTESTADGVPEYVTESFSSEYVKQVKYHCREETKDET